MARTRRFTAKIFFWNTTVMTAMIGIIAMRMSASFQLTNSMMTTQPSTYMELQKISTRLHAKTVPILPVSLIKRAIMVPTGVVL
mgnify:CR=1 FL=1